METVEGDRLDALRREPLAGMALAADDRHEAVSRRVKPRILGREGHEDSQKIISSTPPQAFCDISPSQLSFRPFTRRPAVMAEGR